MSTYPAALTAHLSGNLTTLCHCWRLTRRDGAVTGFTDHDRVLRCLQTLPERERSVLLLTFYDDRSADDVGRELGVQPGHVRVIRHRGLKRLRDCVIQGVGLQ